MKWPDLTFLKMTTVNISTDMKGFIYYIPGTWKVHVSIVVLSYENMWSCTVMYIIVYSL